MSEYIDNKKRSQRKRSEETARPHHDESILDIEMLPLSKPQPLLSFIRDQGNAGPRWPLTCRGYCRR